MTPDPEDADPDQQLRVRYQEGASIRRLAREERSNYGTIRRRLLRAETRLRKHGKRTQRDHD